LKKRIYLILILLFISATTISFYFIQETITKLKNTEIENIYNNRMKEYQNAVYEKKIFLDAFSKFIVQSQPVIDGYLHNNRQEIINFLKPLYKNLSQKHLIKELHFFKKPAISYVNFSNLKKYNIDVSKARKDILFIETSFTPSTHFYICRVYPGFRATYPIIYKDRLLGAVSFGVDIDFLKYHFNSLGAKTSIYFDDNKLKDFLLPQTYKKYSSLKLYEGLRVDGVFHNLDLTKKYIVKNGIIFTIIPIKDIFNNRIAYLIIQDNINKYINIIKKAATKKIIIEISTYFIILLIVMLLFNAIFKKLATYNEILEFIKHKQFNKIPKKVNQKDEFDRYENSLIEVANDIKSYLSILKNEVEEYQNKAYIDGLTKVFNRMFLEENKKKLILKAEIQNKPLSVIMLDIDDFKKINDTYGHDIGDLVLVKLAQTIKSSLRKSDYLIRYGGEEFVVILYLNIDDALKVAEKIRKEIEELEINLPNNKILHFTISLGVSHILENETNLFDIIKRADEKLYKAKLSGKNQVQI